VPVWRLQAVPLLACPGKALNGTGRNPLLHALFLDQISRQDGARGSLLLEFCRGERPELFSVALNEPLISHL
jgi:hypothetical protein